MDLPNINQHAVAHTQLFRNTVNNFDTAAQIQTVSGSYFFDAGLTIGTTYYYWIKMVSINGTVGDVIGPASAVMQPTGQQIIDLLEGQITSGVLDPALRSQIDSIVDVSSGLSDEEQERLFGDSVLSELLAGLQSSLGAIDTLVASEILERISGDSALVAQVNTILAQSNANAAAIQSEQVVRATADSSIAAAVNTLQSTTAGNSASIQTIQLTQNGLSAQWMLKTDVNGRVAGFGLYNDGATSQFIVNADLFAIGKPGIGGANKYPFMLGLVNGQTQIVLNAATFIPDATISNLMIGNYIQSDNYNPATFTGWRIDKSGYAHLNGVTVRDEAGNILMSSGGGTNWAGVTGGNKPADGATSGNVNELQNARFQVDTALWSTYIDAGSTTEYEFGRNRVNGSTRYFIPGEGTLYIKEIVSTTKRAYWNSGNQPVSCVAGQSLEVSCYVAMSTGVTVRLAVQYRDAAGNIVTGLTGADTDHLITVGTLANSTFTGVESLTAYSQIAGFITVP